MKNSDLIENFRVAYNATFSGNHTNAFNGSNIQAEVFGRILAEFSLRGTGKYAFTIKNAGGAWATFICPCLPGGGIPGSDSMRVGHKVTVLLHWYMKYEFLDNLTSWGHEKCPYKVEEVDYSVVKNFEEEIESNYWNLYDAIVLYKETGKWDVEECE